MLKDLQKCIINEAHSILAAEQSGQYVKAVINGTGQCAVSASPAEAQGFALD